MYAIPYTSASAAAADNEKTWTNNNNMHSNKNFQITYNHSSVVNKALDRQSEDSGFDSTTTPTFSDTM